MVRHNDIGARRKQSIAQRQEIGAGHVVWRGIMIDTKLLEILACPACRGDVEYDMKNEKIICVECGRKYPVKDGIPVMLVEEAEGGK